MKVLIVDGYNAAYKAPHIRALLDKSLMAARNAVTELAKNYQRRTGGFARVVVVFDGQDKFRDEKKRGPKEQVFSATGRGDDEVIKAAAKYAAAYHVVVATDDNHIRNNARAYNASVISIDQLASAAAPRKKNIPRAEHEKVSSAEAKKINDELKRYYNL